MTLSSQQRTSDELFDLQTRLLDVEKRVGLSANASNDDPLKKLASLQNRLDQLDEQFKVVQGQVDSYKSMMASGNFPDSDNPQSLGGQFKAMHERLLSLEAAQMEVLKSLENKKSSLNKLQGQTPSAGPHHLSNNHEAEGSKEFDLKQAENALKTKQYERLLEQGPELAKKLKHKDGIKLKFWMAESNFKLNKFSEAALLFSEVTKSGLLKSDLPHISLRLGDCFRKLGDKSTAAIYYKEIAQLYPTSQEAKKSKERLQSLNLKTKT